jgi:catechol 2,3-dioxygenase-like lactoylglutathione lyase family enzyme
MLLLIDQIGLVARSLEQSVPFYQAIFGAPPVST